jgi:hypothetical protein
MSINNNTACNYYACFSTVKVCDTPPPQLHEKGAECARDDKPTLEDHKNSKFPAFSISSSSSKYQNLKSNLQIKHTAKVLLKDTTPPLLDKHS